MSLHRRLTALGLIVAGLLAACGNDGVAPRDWASSVCSALAPWRGKIEALSTVAQQQLANPASSVQTRQNLVDLLGGAETASEAARVRLVAAGTPDVKDGARIAERFVDSLRAARDAYAHAKATVDGLDVATGPAFYAAVRAAFERLNQEYSGSALDTTSVESVELQRAFAEVPECR
jgi:hypothetical protein